MSKLSDKFAAGKKALAERQVELGAQHDVVAPSPSSRSLGPTHGSVSTMKIDMLKAQVAELKAGNPVLKLPAKLIGPIVMSTHSKDPSF